MFSLQSFLYGTHSVMNPVGFFSNSLNLYVLFSDMYGSFTGVWYSADFAPASVLYAGVRVGLFQALAWVFKAIWRKQKIEGPLFWILSHKRFPPAELLDCGMIQVEQIFAEVTENPGES